MNRSFNDVMRAVCHHGGVTSRDVRGRARSRKIAKCRHVVMFLARKWTPHSLAEIGGLVGGRDHSTILWGVEKIGRLLQDDEDRELVLLVKLAEFDLQEGVNRGVLSELEVTDPDPHGEDPHKTPYVTATYTRPDGSRWLFMHAMTRSGR